MHDLFKSAFHVQKDSSKLLKYSGSVIMPREHVVKVLVDPQIEQILYTYAEQKRQEDLKEDGFDIHKVEAPVDDAKNIEEEK